MRTLLHYLLHQHRYENVVRWEPDSDAPGMWTKVLRCTRCGHLRLVYYADNGAMTP